MSDRSTLTNLCLIGVLAFLVLSSGVLQCVYNCMEQDVSRRSAIVHASHSAPVTGCHLTFPETVQTASCPDRSCHQSQAPNRSLGGPEYSINKDAPEPLLSGFRLPLPDCRSGQPLKQNDLPVPVILASWHPPTTTSQTLLGVRTTVLLN